MSTPQDQQPEDHDHGDRSRRPARGCAGRRRVRPACTATTRATTSVTDLVEQPAKVMRIGRMVQQLLEEVKSAPLDEAGRKRLATVLHTSIKELKDGLAPELDEELDRLIQPFDEDTTPASRELRIAQAQLVGWLEGLFHGIQTAIYAQQMAARSQLEQMRRALPPGAMPGMATGQQQGDRRRRPARFPGRDVPLEGASAAVVADAGRGHCGVAARAQAAASSRPLARAARDCVPHSAWG